MNDPNRAAFEAALPAIAGFIFEPVMNSTERREDGLYRQTVVEAAWRGWQASRKAALEEAANIARTTCHHESTPFADGFNQAALNIEHVTRSLK